MYAGTTSVVTLPVGQLVTLLGQAVMVKVLVVYTVLVVRRKPVEVAVGLGDCAASVTGQTVVYAGTTSVVTLPLGQSVTLLGQAVMVYVLVVYTVLVVRRGPSVFTVGLGDCADWVTGQTVVYSGIVSVTTLPVGQSAT